MLFPIADYWPFYAGFTVLVLALLALDLGLFHRKAHVAGFREAALWLCVWAGLALLFCLGLYAYSRAEFGGAPAKQVALEFLTGYIVEESLSLDNMFVFVLVFSYFQIPAQFQHRVLFYGILGALVFRGIFIAAGSALLQYSWMTILFGIFLIGTGIKMMLSSEREIQPEKALATRLLRKIFPITPELRGQRLFARVDGKLHATPLLLAVAVIEASDILFAVDSVPAIFAVTKEPFIVYTSNVFAILGLRSMYFLLVGAIGRFHLLRYGLAVILIFVGFKMIWHVPTVISLLVIGGVLGVAIGLSLAFPKREAVGG
ncbi:MAG TPA: TerC family protein [Bryobacteraceae bacterium]|nr:TerC family protein [Bryobacteraceae bacterium]